MIVRMLLLLALLAQDNLNNSVQRRYPAQTVIDINKHPFHEFTIPEAIDYLKIQTVKKRKFLDYNRHIHLNLYQGISSLAGGPSNFPCFALIGVDSTNKKIRIFQSISNAKLSAARYILLAARQLPQYSESELPHLTVAGLGRKIGTLNFFEHKALPYNESHEASFPELVNELTKEFSLIPFEVQPRVIYTFKENLRNGNTISTAKIRFKTVSFLPTSWDEANLMIEINQKLETTSFHFKIEIDNLFSQTLSCGDLSVIF